MKISLKSVFVSSALAAVGFLSTLLLSKTNSADALYEARTSANLNKQSAHGAHEYFMHKHASLDGTLDYNNLLKGIKDAESYSYKKSGSIGIQWSSMGPNNLGGRTREILVDKDNPQLMWMGGVSGGIFKSTDGGNLWTPIDDMAPNGIISCFAQAINGDIYVGTGNIFEGFGNPEWPGMGIYKSTDGGSTFNLLPSTFPVNNAGIPDSNSVTANWAAVQRIVCDPNDANTLFAGTNRGLQISKDGGATWFNPLYVDCPSTNIVQLGAIHDIEYNADKSRLFVVVAGGLYYSDAPTETCSYTRVLDGVPGSSQRMEIAHAPSDKNIIYVSTVVANDFDRVFKSTNNGERFTLFSPAPPINDENWDLCGAKRGSGQCFYDWAMIVDPNNPNLFFLGGVQLWRYDGNWTRAASEARGTDQTTAQFYVHADKHGFKYSPHNSRQHFTLSDGGLSISNDGGYTFLEANRNYVTTQYYGVAFSTEGTVVGGTQDNGNIIINSPEVNGGDLSFGFVGFNQGITNGDGFDAEISQIVDVKFTTAQFGNVGRSPINNLSGSGICEANINLCDAAPFWTVIRLWESDNDLTSKDSIEYVNERLSQGIGVGNNSRRTFNGVFEPIQKSASILYNTVSFSAGASEINYSNGTFTGDGTGTLNTSTGEYTVTFNNAPALNLAVFANYDMVFDAGDTLEVRSETNNIPIKHVLASALNPGQTVMIQDPVQSFLAMGINQGLALTRGAININKQINWINISQGLNSSEAPISGSVNAIEYTKDGNTMFVAANNRIFKVTGLNDLYVAADRSKLTSRVIWQSSEGNVSGLTLHPENEEHLIACVSSFGAQNQVNLITNALSTTGVASTSSSAKMGLPNSDPLPRLPVYDAEWDIMNPSRIIVGTLYGVWATNDIYANDVSWSFEGSTMGRFPVYDIRQQHLPFNKASNHEVIYAGTYGRGVWKSESLVSVKDFTDIRIDNNYKPDLKIYPNPVVSTTQISYEMPLAGQGMLRVFTITGNLVYENTKALSQGENIINFDASKLPQGTYITTLQVGGHAATGKFVKY